MDFTDVVRRRRMVRRYRPDEVDPRALDRIIDVARRAPSAGFAQGQHLVVVTDPGRRTAIAQLASEPRYAAAGFEPWLSVAPVHVAVCLDERDYHLRYREPDKLVAGTEMPWPLPYWWVDTGAILMLLLLAAVDEGLAAGFFGAHRLPGLRNLLEVPDEVVPVGIVTIGHAAPGGRTGSARRGRRPEAEVVHWQSWGGTR